MSVLIEMGRRQKIKDTFQTGLGMRYLIKPETKPDRF
jgi:hypothetical protein